MSTPAMTAEEAAREFAETWSMNLCTRNHAGGHLVAFKDDLTSLLTTYAEQVRREAIERCARTAEHTIAAEFTGLRKPRWRDGDKVAKALRALLPPSPQSSGTTPEGETAP